MVEASQRISVVTGAAGFVGQALVRRLLAAGDWVRAIVLRGDPLVRELVGSGHDTRRLEICEGDVSEYATIAAAFAGADRVFHTAALVHAWAARATFRRVNVSGTQNVARAVQEYGVRRLVAVSTSDVFGLPEGGCVFDESSPFREWDEPYADTKIEATRWLLQYRRDTAVGLSIIYPGWVYGPGDRAFFPGLAEAIRSGAMLFWFHGVRLPWVYIDNLVDACVLASTQPHAVGEGYIVFDTDEGPTLEDVCARIADTIGARRPTRHVPYAVAYGAAWTLQRLWTLAKARHAPPLLTVDVKAFGSQFHLSNRKAHQQLMWTPKVSVEHGMQLALQALTDPSRRQ